MTRQGRLLRRLVRLRPHEIVRFWGGVRSRLFLIFLIAIIPLAAFQIKALQDTRAARVAQAVAAAQADAQAGARRYEEAVNRAYTVLDLISRAPQVSLGTANTCGHFLREIDPSRSISGTIRVLDAQSRVICAADDNLLGVAGPLPLEAVATGGHRSFHVSGFMIGADDAPQTLAILFDEGLGAMEPRYYVATMDDAWFQSFVSTLRSDFPLVVSLHDAAGHMLVRRGDAYPSGVTQWATQGRTQERMQGSDSLISGQAALPGGEGYIRVAYDGQALLADIDAIIRHGYFVLVAILLIIAITAFWAGQRLVIAPIEALRLTAARLARGDFSVRVQTERFDSRSEFALLAKAFNRMAERLEDRERERDATQRQLEAKELELLSVNRKLEALAHSDGLTGLANRRRLDERLAEAWQAMAEVEAPLALIAIDIDHFKLYNDNYGHPAGDSCLRQVARLIAASAVRSEDLAARCGGEEFAILLPDLPPQHLQTIAEMVRVRVFDAALERDDAPLGRVTVSVGAALVYPTPGASSESLRIAADNALYEAKRAGRNRSVIECDSPPEKTGGDLRISL